MILPSSETSSRLIVLADADPNGRSLIAHRLRKEPDVKSIVIENGAEALRMLEDRRDVSLLVHAFRLPGLGGLALLQRLKQQYGGPPVPIVLFGWERFDAEEVAARKLGAADVIHKPFALEETTERLLQLVRNSSVSL